jgi:flagellum-specific peptidoglycan hydrolase FlgJ
VKDKTLLYITGAGLALLALLKGAEKFMVNMEDKKNFKRAMLPITVSIEKEFGIKPSITLAQAALESGWGKSGLTAQANNLFGFTAEGSWLTAGKPVVYMKTAEYVAGVRVVVQRPFRKYPSWYDSVRNWAEIISGLSRYKAAYSFAKTGDVNNYAVAVKAGGYATDPAYAPKIVAFDRAVKEVILT